MSETAILLSLSAQSPPELVDPRLLELKRMVLAAVVSPHSKRNYEKALDDLFLFTAGQPLTRALLMDWHADMEELAPSTINVRLSASDHRTLPRVRAGDRSRRQRQPGTMTVEQLKNTGS